MKVKTISTRANLGVGKGRGYYNLVPYDSYVHSLAARGQSVYLDAEGKSFLAQVAEKAHQKVDWAVKWEKEHLPQQTEAVKNAFNSLKERARGLLKRTTPKTTQPEMDTTFVGPPEPSLMDTMVAAPEPPAPVGPQPPSNAPLPPPKPISPTLGERIRSGAAVASRQVAEVLEKKRQERRAFDEEVSHLSDAALRELAVHDPHPSIFSNKSKYEQALLERIKRRAKIDRDIQEVERRVHHETYVAPKQKKEKLGDVLSNPLAELFKF